MEPDDDEFERFFTAEYDGLLRSIEATIGDRETAVDATQDAFIKAHMNWAEIRTYQSPAAWVRRTAINASRDRQRSERRRRDREATVVASDVANSIGGSEGVEADASARHLLAQLSGGQREIATMFYVHDLRVEDIAVALGLSTGTVKSQLSEARHRLRQLNQR